MGDDNLMGEAYLEDANLINVRYEDLVSNTKRTLIKIFEFIGERFEESCLEFHQEPKYYYSEILKKPKDQKEENHLQFRNWQINQPLFDGRGKWKEMTPEDKLIVKRIINKKLMEYGYIDNYDW